MAQLRYEIWLPAAALHPTCRDPGEEKRLERKRARLRRRLELEALSLLTRRMLNSTPNSEAAKAALSKANDLVPRHLNKPGTYVSFETDRRTWSELVARFAPLCRRNGVQQPEYAILGAALAQLSDPEIRELVADACDLLPQFRGVKAFAPAPLSS